MSKSSIVKKYNLSASGILEINDYGVFIENQDNGDLIDFRDLMLDFKDKTIKLSVSYDEDF